MPGGAAHRHRDEQPVRHPHLRPRLQHGRLLRGRSVPQRYGATALRYFGSVATSCAVATRYAVATSCAVATRCAVVTRCVVAITCAVATR
jgi:hypothetical protein